MTNSKRQKQLEEQVQLLQEVPAGELSKVDRQKSPIVDVDESELSIERTDVDESELSVVLAEENAPATLLRESGYTYKFERRSNDKLHYSCARASRCECKATITTDGQKIIDSSHAHNHQPDHISKSPLNDSDPSNGKVIAVSSQ